MAPADFGRSRTVHAEDERMAFYTKHLLRFSATVAASVCAILLTRMPFWRWILPFVVSVARRPSALPRMPMPPSC
jgi:hypothetical protein